MKITALEIENFKKIDQVEISPGDRALVIIGGANRAGKSSVLDALSAALGGKGEVPIDPIKHGKKTAEIRVELDDGELVVTRRITTGGTNTLEVRDANGKKRTPQKLLDSLVGSRFLDPLKFAACDAKKQREMLLDVVDVGLDLDEWAAKRVEIYENRTRCGHEVKRLEGELSGLPENEDIGDEIDVGALTQRMAELSEQQVQCAENDHRVKEAMRRVTEEKAMVEDLEIRLSVAQDHLEEELKELKRHEQARDEYGKFDPATVKDLQQEMADARARNRKVVIAKEREERRTALASKLKKIKRLRELKTEEIEGLDRAKVDALAAVEFPVAGLGIEEGGVTYGGVPFSQASGAEQLRVSLSIAMALTPEIRDIWVKDGSLLDDESLAAVRELAEAKQCRVWLERVGDRDDDAIVICDGMVAGEPCTP